MDNFPLGIKVQMSPKIWVGQFQVYIDCMVVSVLIYCSAKKVIQLIKRIYTLAYASSLAVPPPSDLVYRN